MTYTPGKISNDGTKIEGPAYYHIIHNGVVIHDKIELGKPRTGNLNMQDHGNPVEYRNIWMVLMED